MPRDEYLAWQNSTALQTEAVRMLAPRLRIESERVWDAKLAWLAAIAQGDTASKFAADATIAERLIACENELAGSYRWLGDQPSPVSVEVLLRQRGPLFVIRCLAASLAAVDVVPEANRAAHVIDRGLAKNLRGVNVYPLFHATAMGHKAAEKRFRRDLPEDSGLLKELLRDLAKPARVIHGYLPLPTFDQLTGRPRVVPHHALRGLTSRRPTFPVVSAAVSSRSNAR